MTTDATRVLTDVSRAIAWDDVPDEPGWYCVHVDGAGARDLSAATGTVVRPGVLYVGEARGQTLQRHLVWHENIGQHTLRLSLAGVLASSLRLHAQTWNVLERQSKDRLARWMTEHLVVVTAPLGDAANLTWVINQLDPPLNLTRAGPSALRARVRDLRRAIRRTAAMSRG